MSARLTEMWAGLLTETAGLRPGQRFLDVGGGDGALCAAMAITSGAEGTVLDPGDFPVLPGVSRVIGRVEDMPFPAASFDAVLMGHVLHVLEDPRRALMKAAAVLKPGGRLLIRTSSHADLRALHGFILPPDVLKGMLDVIPDVALIEGWLDEAGFDDVTGKTVDTPFPGTMNEWIVTMARIAHQQWAAWGCSGDDPRSAVEHSLRRRYTDPPPKQETLLTAHRPCSAVP